MSQKVNEVLNRIGQESQIAVVREIANTFEEQTYPGILDQLAESLHAHPADDTDEPATVSDRKQTISVRSIHITGTHRVLETEEDIDHYLGALRAALIEALNDNKRISL